MSSSSQLPRSILECPDVYLRAGPPGPFSRGKDGNEGKEGPPGPPGKSDTYQIPNLFGLHFSASSSKTEQINPNTVVLSLLNGRDSYGLTNPTSITSAITGGITANINAGGNVKLPPSITGLTQKPASLAYFNLDAFGFNVGNLFSTAPVELTGTVFPSLVEQYTITSTVAGSLASNPAPPLLSTLLPVNIGSTGSVQTPTGGAFSNILFNTNTFFGWGRVTFVSSRASPTSDQTEFTYAVTLTIYSNVILPTPSSSSTVTNTTNIGISFPLIPSNNGNIVIEPNQSYSFQLEFTGVSARGVLTSIGMGMYEKSVITQSIVTPTTNNMLLLLSDIRHGMYIQIPIVNGFSSGGSLSSPINFPDIITSSNQQSIVTFPISTLENSTPYQFSAYVGIHESRQVNYDLNFKLLSLPSQISTGPVSSATLSLENKSDPLTINLTKSTYGWITPLNTTTFEQDIVFIYKGLTISFTVTSQPIQTIKTIRPKPLTDSKVPEPTFFTISVRPGLTNDVHITSIDSDGANIYPQTTQFTVSNNDLASGVIIDALVQTNQ
jgi:hypothetical protein